MHNLSQKDMQKLAATMPKFYSVSGGLPTPQPWLPETAVNGYTVTHQPIEAGFPLKLNRGGFLMFDEPITLSVLRAPDGSIWMSDSPSEILDALDLIPLLPSGNILIGGVGIGLVPWLIGQMRDDISHLTLVDINPVAYQLAQPRLDELEDFGLVVDYVTGDFREYLETADLSPFDGIFMDIWGALDFDSDLPDMMSLFEQFGIPGATAVWGADLCVKGLADQLMLFDAGSAIEVLGRMGFAEMVYYLQNNTDPGDDNWLANCYPRLIQAAQAAYGYQFLNLNNALSATLVSATSR